MDEVSLPVRKHTRLKEYDYSQNGCYFVTVCVKDKKSLLSAIIKDSVGANCVRPKLTEYGKIVDNEFKILNNTYKNVFVDNYIIMPDHIHAIITINDEEGGRTQFAPTLSRIIKQFKGSITKKIGFSIWQRGFNDRIIRNQVEYENKWSYIQYNALKEYPNKFLEG